MIPYLAPVALLFCSNVFMTFAWYGQLKFPTSALWATILVSWGIAFFEYCLAVPANRIGHQVYSAAQLKTMQEIISLIVFAVFSEEWGLIGGVLLIIAFFSVILWGIRVALNAPTRFGRLAAAGLASTLFFYVAINLGMVMGLAPVVGIPLPLVSFGGSAQMTVLICLGILMSIDRQTRIKPRF